MLLAALNIQDAVLCAGEVQILGGDVQTLEDEANADVADTLIDDALGELLPSCWAWLHFACDTMVDITDYVCSAHFVRQHTM